ncbi:MAG: ABC transporter permease [Mesorhizobium sp.]|nr:MAG: ABC transporter permease [Mesorhizobium sp.]
MPLIFDIAVTHIAGRGRQTLVAVIGVAVGVGFSIAMAALMQGGQDDFVRQLVDTMPHVDISDEQRTARRQPAEDAFTTVAISGLRPRDDRRGIINPTAATSWLESWIPGRFAALAAGGNNVLIGDTMASRLGAGYGDTITAVSSEGLTRNFKIAGLFHTGTTARDEGEAYVLLKNAQILSARPNAINEIRIKLDDPNRAPVVAHRAETELGYKAVAWQEANESILEALVVRNVIMYTVVGAIMLVAGFGIYNIISTITHEKARDIAIMKSLGFPEADMRRLFLLEGVAIGAAGSLLGGILGVSMTYALSLVRFEIAATGQEMTRLPIAWSLMHYVIASAFALGSAAVAGYLPARRAARLNPVEIIRGAS